MKKIIILSHFVLLLPFISCTRPDKSPSLTEEIRIEFKNGNFSSITHLRDSLAKQFPDKVRAIREADSLIGISFRIREDFSLSSEQIIQRLRNVTDTINDQKMSEWEARKWLEYRLIDGEKRYFNRAASNLMLLKSFYEDHENLMRIIADDPTMLARKEHSIQIIDLSQNNTIPVLPVRMKIDYTLTVIPNAIPDGEIIRCWLPWPKGNHPRQTDPELIAASEPHYIISGDSSLHRTIYMEKKAVSNEPTVFSISFTYSSSGQFFNFDSIKSVPYDKTSSFFREYTSEQLPQINFGNQIRRLADSLTSRSDDPKVIVNKIYMWFKENLPWTGALEYSTMPDIPGYVIEHKRGDCGMQTFLLMSMLRYKGIPVRWQSGWMVPRGAENLHDWCEVWYEGTGWVPLDVSYDLQDSERKEVKKFYMSGIDSYRMIVNDGIAGELYPRKTFMRSEPFDFQRGEVEWTGGNLYFDKWDYTMDIDYLNDK